MAKDRVETLTYRLIGVPKTAAHENSVFKMEIIGEVATFHLKKDFGSLEQAERAISEFLRSFEGDELLQGKDRTTFSWERGRMKSGSSIYIGPTFALNIVGVIAEANARDQSPWRFPAVSKTPEAAALSKRYEEYRAGSEKLANVAYASLSFLEGKAGGRKEAAAKFGVDLDILRRIGELTSTRGDLSSARKLKTVSSPLTAAEEFWLEAATRSLIKRIHEVESSMPLSRISIGDLP